MHIFRIEHSDSGLGPYRHTDAININGMVCKKRPCINSDYWENKQKTFKIFNDKTHANFGFASIQQLKLWFNKAELKEMHNHRFVIREYWCRDPHVSVGSRQVIFLKNKGVLLNTRSIMDIIK